MIQTSIKKLPASQGVREVLEMIKLNYLASAWKKSIHSGINTIYKGTRQVEQNGVPYIFTYEEVYTLQHVITAIGVKLMQTKVEQGPQTEESSPMCYGEDMVSKFKVLGKIIKLPHLFIDVMGKTECWQKMHLSGKNPKYYNQFSDNELEMINQGIQSIALSLCSINLEYEGTNKEHTTYEKIQPAISPTSRYAETGNDEVFASNGGGKTASNDNGTKKSLINGDKVKQSKRQGVPSSRRKRTVPNILLSTEEDSWLDEIPITKKVPND